MLNNILQKGPLFLYDLDGLKLHAKKINSGVCKLFYACKANPLSSIIKTLDEAKLNFDVASEGELRQVLSQGVSGERIIITGPAKTETFYRLAILNRVSTVVIESPYQLSILEKISEECQFKPNVLLRLQLKWDNRTANILGGDKTTPFGMDVDTAFHLLSNLKFPFLGFHVFQWGNILSLDQLYSIWEYSIKMCKQLRDDFQVLDVGGGIGIPYDDKVIPLKWEDIQGVILKLKEKYSIPEFWCEMGRYMSGPFGQYFVRVIDVKRVYQENIIVLEGGMNHLARSALVSQSFPADLVRSSSSSLSKFLLHGPLCTSLDYFGQYMLPEDISIGDYIVFSQVGAYGFTESMPFFLCHKLAGEAIKQNGSIQVIRDVQPASVWIK